MLQVAAISLLFSSQLSVANYSNNRVKTTDTLAAQKAFIQTMNQCGSPKKLSGIMTQALKNTDNYHVKAKNAQVFEVIMLNNPACFVQAANRLPQKDCKQLQANFINEPFFNPRDEIKLALSRAREYSTSCIAS